ncbi:MAG: hypothetical protein ACLF0G_15600 [Candidatus Brocadiia bacterium]
MAGTRLCLLGLVLWCAASAATSGESTGPDAPAEQAEHLVILQDKTPVLYNQMTIGQLAEGTRVRLLESDRGYAHVRASFGDSWFQGWVRQALTAVDSLENVDVQVGHATRGYIYQGVTAPSGLQFLEVRVRLTATDEGPPRVYFHLAEGPEVDLYLVYGRDQKAYVYGFMRRLPMSKRRVFETTQKQQTLLLKPGETLEETYVFPVPVRATKFHLVLKDVVHRVPLRR